MNSRRQLITLHLVIAIGLAGSGFGCASKSDLAQLREEMLGNVAMTRSGMEQRLQATTQLDARKQQESVGFQSQLKDLQHQVKDLQHQVGKLGQTIGQVGARVDLKFQDLDRMLTEMMSTEESELKNRLQMLDRSLNHLQHRSQDAGKIR
jgi:septal ring factor EnvC (AmiA/AmiB activator)